MADQVTGLLDEWHFDGSSRLIGRLYGDTKGRFQDGTEVKTSTVTAGIAQKGQVIETRNSRYMLGNPRSTTGG